MKEEGREKERERNIDVRGKLISCLFYVPDRGQNSKPRHVS